MDLLVRVKKSRRKTEGAGKTCFMVIKQSVHSNGSGEPEALKQSKYTPV